MNKVGDLTFGTVTLIIMHSLFNLQTRYKSGLDFLRRCFKTFPYQPYFKQLSPNNLLK